MTNPTACRDAFEKWLYEKNKDAFDEIGATEILMEHESGEHVQPWVRVKYEAWQAAWNTRHTEGEAVAWLHDVVQGDGEPDQALSFSKDSFPLDTELGFRSLGSRPLFLHPPMPASADCSTCKGTGRQSYLMGDVQMLSPCSACQTSEQTKPPRATSADGDDK